MSYLCVNDRALMNDSLLQTGNNLCYTLATCIAGDGIHLLFGVISSVQFCVQCICFHEKASFI